MAFDFSRQLVASMSRVEGPVRLCLLNASIGKRSPHCHNSILYAEIDDHGVRRGNMGRILTRWRHPVASMVAQYVVMRSSPYRLSRMAIGMAREAGPLYSVIDIMSCVTVAKRPCYGRLKINPSYNIVHYNDIS